ncbi:class I adenylate-forming enzyme family protein [Bremerella sp. P1]|uniref:class I adenylate-forming enzyme family protein n=1 Tax=Bremerella sp. P1 TaxID=3026424 RepID=UPI0023675433|nr:class I adenylate-forming enzyme family protein [Bremerella sp. P1]WDI41381.1 class I adenylate-forming enzyme family protein [Bremerella sp. P1]
MATYRSLQQLLSSALEASSGKVALRSRERELSYAELDHGIQMVAAGLHALGITKGDRVAWYLPNCVEAVFVTMACYRIGAIAVPLNYRYVAEEVEDVVARTQARLLVYAGEKADTVAPVIQAKDIVSVVVGDEAERSRAFASLLTAGTIAEPTPVAADDPALILFTSGSTGHPKGVMHSHEGVYSAIDQSRKLFDFQAKDVVLVGKSISHAGGLQTQMLPALLAGSKVLLEMKPTPARAVEAITKYGVTEYGLLASDLLDFIEYLEQEQHRLPTLNNAIGSGDSVPADLHHRFRDLLGWEVMEGAGMTEVGCYYSANPRYGTRKWGSLGVPTPGTQLRIVNEDGTDCEAGQHGEIVLKMKSATIGYWNDDNATHALFRDGWLHTGDLGYEDAEGYVWFVGRKKLMIIRRGSNIAPAEVENVLDEHPLVHASIVVGVRDPHDGQVPVACVALAEGAGADSEAAIRDFVRQHLAAYKNPVHYLFLDALPRTGTGKFDRHTLMERAERTFG